MAMTFRFDRSRDCGTVIYAIHLFLIHANYCKNTTWPPCLEETNFRLRR